MKPLSTVLSAPLGDDLTVGELLSVLSMSHPDLPVRLKIGDKLVSIKDVRQVSTGPGEPVLRVLTASDFVLSTT